MPDCAPTVMLRCFTRNAPIFSHGPLTGFIEIQLIWQPKQTQNSLEIHPTTEATRFVLEKGWDSRTKWLLGISACLAFAHALQGIIFFYFNSTDYDGTINAAPLLFGLVLLIAGLRLLGGAQRKDTLVVNAENVTLCEHKGMRTTTRTFNKSEITNWRFLDKPAISEHALAGKTFDYLGFQTQQYLIAEIAGDNRIAFDYEGGTITFGRQLYSWDFNAIMQVVENRKQETNLPDRAIKSCSSTRDLSPTRNCSE